MPRNAILNHNELEALLAFPSSDAEISRHYTLSEDDLILIRQHRGEHNRLGFAIQLCYLRYPGFPLPANDTPPRALLNYISYQLCLSAESWPRYATRDETRREHLLELQKIYGFRPFDRAEYRKSVQAMADLVWQTDKGILIAEALIEHLRQQLILLPTSYVIERACTESVIQGNRRIYKLLTSDLTATQRNQLDTLLKPHEKTRASVLSWLRLPPGAAKASSVLKHVDRLRKIREIGISAGLGRQIHQNRLLKLAREGGQMTAQHLRELEPLRRYATLVAVLIETQATLIDEIVDLHDRIINTKFTTAKHKHAESFHRSGKAINDKVMIFCKLGRALLAARASCSDPFEAVESVISWEELSVSIEDATTLVQPPEFDFLGLLGDSYHEIRRYSPALLANLQLNAAPIAQDLLQGVDTLKTIYEKQLRKVPNDAPTTFISKRWEGQILKDEGIDRRFYELCVLSELKDKLRSGDIWVQGSRQFKDFEEYLLPPERFNTLRRKNILPLSIETDCEKYLNEQFDLLRQQLQTVENLANTGQLPDARFNDKGRLIITPLKKDVPAPVKALQQLVYPRLPHVKITELLLEVNTWTGFAQRFTHTKSGMPAQDIYLLLTAILASAINQGLSKMAECCPGTGYAKLAWVNAWHIRDETYSSALADLTNAQHRQPFAAYWGDGTTSSSDGKWLRTGGRGTAAGYLNAKHGTGTGATLYSHISDKLSRFYIQAINSQVRDSTLVLDGLLYHESDIRIKEHYTDTAGFTDHVFAIMPMLGFNFAPHIRDLQDKKLYIVGDSNAYPTLANIIGGQIQVKYIRAQWEEVLRLGSSIAEGTVTASLMLKKLSSYPRQNGLALALREIGRIERTLFTLAWLQSPVLRRRVRVGLNKGEACNALVDAVSFNRRGELQDRSLANQQYRASGLNLVVAAIIHWNTVYLERVINTLRNEGYKIDDELVKHLSPLIWAHINLSGDYDWGQASVSLRPGEFRPLRKGEA